MYADTMNEAQKNAYAAGVIASLNHPILLRWEDKYYHKLCADCRDVGQDMVQLVKGNNAVLDNYVQVKILPNHCTTCIGTYSRENHLYPIFIIE